MKTFMSKHPEITANYVLYQSCRSVQLFSIEATHGQGRQAKNVVRVVPFPTGYHSLPEQGGLLDQPHRMMEFFGIFMNAERTTAYQTLGK